MHKTHTKRWGLAIPGSRRIKSVGYSISFLYPDAVLDKIGKLFSFPTLESLNLKYN